MYSLSYQKAQGYYGPDRDRMQMNTTTIPMNPSNYCSQGEAGQSLGILRRHIVPYVIEKYSDTLRVSCFKPPDVHHVSTSHNLEAKDCTQQNLKLELTSLLIRGAQSCDYLSKNLMFL